ncbi:TetR/AcrR family transcriptional regulator [Mycobacterium paraintracellulare]|uniref:TetR/AcrR family transcriptional regulator n=1 Tax=Mycobacterium paraintracellulare TaxID=1138383 RepID=UPI001927D7D1|nr:TetR/AcrR family transcriptional regulator [Mycobacterium paraintracellulare]BCP14196.1 hypothetical protein MINTM021_11050 [Mycobacterium paraintracellulare]
MAANAARKANARKSASPGGGRRGETTRARSGEERTGPSNARRELVENQLYQEASRLFGERGFAGTSFQDIADALGMTRPSLYYYVKSKEDLFASVVTELTEGNAAQVRSIRRSTSLDARAKLERIAHLVALSCARQPSQFLLVARSEAQLPPELLAKHKRAMRDVLNDVIRVIDDGVEAGLFRPMNTHTAAFAVLGMCNWVAWWYQPGGNASEESIAQEIASLAVAMVSDPVHHTPGASRPHATLAMMREGLNYLEQSLGIRD